MYPRTTKPRDNPHKNVLAFGPQQTTSQLNIPRTPIMQPLQPRTQMVYSHTPNIYRHQLTESEPLSPYSEMLIPMTPLHQTRQLNQTNISNFGSQESMLQPQLQIQPNLYPREAAISDSQDTKKLGNMEMRPQRMGFHAVSSSPYARSSFTPSTHSKLLPTPIPQHSLLTETPRYRYFQPIPAPSTSSSTSDKNSFPREGAKTEVFGITTIDIRATTVLQDDKLTGNNHTRFLIGSIDQIVNWNFLAKKADLKVIYEVTGILDSISHSHKGSYYKMIIRDSQKSNSILHAEFFPIDRDIVHQIHSGGLITFTGCMKGARMLQVLNMWPTKANSLAGLKRISFLCQRTLQEACLSTNEP